MRRFNTTVSIALVLLSAAARPISAHHSVQGLFDLTKPIAVTGAITKVEWTNPHSYIDLDAKDEKGTVRHWVFELPGSSKLQRVGLTAADRSLSVGEVVTIEAIAARDGSPTGYVSKLHLPDGRVVVPANATSR
jgi:hypothetical protein